MADITYNMKRVANLNPGMLVTSTRKHRVEPVSGITSACRRGLGYGKKDTLLYANMNQFNQYCGPNGLDMPKFVPAIWGHEGNGYNGGKGHETLALAAAADSMNDPYRRIERYVDSDSVALDNNVHAEVTVIGDRIKVRAADNNPINGGPSGNWPTGSNVWLRVNSVWSPFSLTTGY